MKYWLKFMVLHVYRCQVNRFSTIRFIIFLRWITFPTVLKPVSLNMWGSISGLFCYSDLYVCPFSNKTVPWLLYLQLTFIFEMIAASVRNAVGSKEHKTPLMVDMFLCYNDKSSDKQLLVCLSYSPVSQPTNCSPRSFLKMHVPRLYLWDWFSCQDGRWADRGRNRCLSFIVVPANTGNGVVWSWFRISNPRLVLRTWSSDQQHHHLLVLFFKNAVIRPTLHFDLEFG